MNKELTNSQIDLLRNEKYDIYISLLTKRLLVLDTIKKAKSRFVKNDRYKQLKKLNEKIEKLKRELKL